MAECESVEARSTAASSQDELGGRWFHARLQAGSRQYNISYLKGLLLFPVSTLTGRRVRFSLYVECRTSASWPSLAKECKGAPWSASPRAHLKSTPPMRICFNVRNSEIECYLDIPKSPGKSAEFSNEKTYSRQMLCHCMHGFSQAALRKDPRSTWNY